MTLQDAIHAACNDLGVNPPKVVQYDNGTLVAIRNGDGARVATILPLNTKPDAVKHEIATLYKVKPENIVSRATLERVLGGREEQVDALEKMAEPIVDGEIDRKPQAYWKNRSMSPDEIRAFQEGKKAARDDKY